MKLHYLTDAFYDKYMDCKEILQKKDRPYVCITIEVDGRKYAIPVRHHISHKYAFYTIGDSGLDYTKAVLIEDESFLSGDSPIIDTIEWRKIQMNEGAIYVGFSSYLRKYKHALKNRDSVRNDNILKYSALQYFNI